MARDNLERGPDERSSTVSRIVKRAVAFLRWVLAPEQLPVSSGENQRTGPRAQGTLGWLVSGEELVSDHTGTGHQRRGQRFLSWILSPEELPTLSEEPGEDGSLPRSWSWVFSSEVCPQAQTSVSGRRAGLLSWLLSSEVCPEGGSPPARRVGGFLSWLLSPEKL